MYYKYIHLYICNTLQIYVLQIYTSCIETNTLFAIFNNKGLENFKVRPNHNALKGMDTG